MPPLKLGTTNLPKTADANYVEDGESLPVVKIKYAYTSPSNGSVVKDTVWEHEDLILHIRVRSIDYSDGGTVYSWTASNVKKFISQVQIETKNIESGSILYLINRYSSSFPSSGYDLLNSTDRKVLRPGREQIRATVTCKDWCCVDEIRLTTSSTYNSNSGLELIKRSRSASSDDATTQTTTSFKTISSSIFPNSGEAYLWITLSAFHFASQVNISSSTVSITKDRYSDYYYITSQFRMSSNCKADKTKINRKFTVVQPYNGDLSKEFNDEDSDGRYNAYDSGPQDENHPILNPSLGTPMLYILRCAPKDNFVNWHAPNVIYITGGFMTETYNSILLGQYYNS